MPKSSLIVNLTNAYKQSIIKFDYQLFPAPGHAAFAVIPGEILCSLTPIYLEHLHQSPSTQNGGFPERIKSWCTVCRKPAFITNIHTSEKFKLFSEEWVDGNLVLILENGERWEEDQFRKCWKPLICH